MLKLLLALKICLLGPMCPDGAERYLMSNKRARCYMNLAVAGDFTWQAARDQCKSWNPLGDLPVFRTDEDVNAFNLFRYNDLSLNPKKSAVPYSAAYNTMV